jgi:hypothetical protein
VLADLLTRCRRATGGRPQQVAMMLHDLAESLLARNRPADAEPLLRDALALFDRAEPDGWQGCHVRSLLGASLGGQKKFAEAESLVRAGYDGLKAREAQLPTPVRFRLFDARDRAARLYRDWGKPAEADAWLAQAAGR